MKLVRPCKIPRKKYCRSSPEHLRAANRRPRAHQPRRSAGSPPADVASLLENPYSWPQIQPEPCDETTPAQSRHIPPPQIARWRREYDDSHQTLPETRADRPARSSRAAPHRLASLFYRQRSILLFLLRLLCPFNFPPL